MIFCLPLLIITIKSQNITIFAPPMPPHYAVVLAPIIPKNIPVSSDTQFLWSFPSNTDQSCIYNAQKINPCIGRVVDYVFTTTGTYTVNLKISGSSFTNPLTISTDILIKPVEQFKDTISPEVRSMDDAYAQRFITALYTIKDLGIYDHFAILHHEVFTKGVSEGTRRSAAHAGPSFLPWHRMTLRILGKILAYVDGDEAFGIPYWDWSLGWEGIEKYLGPGVGTGPDNLVTEGPFSVDKWPFNIGDNESSGIKRNIGSDAGDFPTSQELDEYLDIPFYDVAPFNENSPPTSFRNVIEGWASEYNATFNGCHNFVHRWMGGTMKDTKNSFNDPIFLIHHSQLNRLFTIWQDRNGCIDGHGELKCYRPGNTDVSLRGVVGTFQVGSEYKLEHQMFNDTLYPWNIRIQDVLKGDWTKYLNPGESPPAKQITPKPSSPVTSKASSIMVHSLHLLVLFLLIFLY
jgi:tyrosinase